MMAGNRGDEPAATTRKSTRISKSRDRSPAGNSGANRNSGIVPARLECVNMYTNEFVIMGD